MPNIGGPDKGFGIRGDGSPPAGSRGIVIRDTVVGDYSIRVATNLGEKNSTTFQELFKDIEVRFQDLFQCRFTAMWGYKK